MKILYMKPSCKCADPPIFKIPSSPNMKWWPFDQHKSKVCHTSMSSSRIKQFASFFLFFFVFKRTQCLGDTWQRSWNKILATSPCRFELATSRIKRSVYFFFQKRKANDVATRGRFNETKFFHPLGANSNSQPPKLSGPRLFKKNKAKGQWNGDTSHV